MFSIDEPTAASSLPAPAAAGTEGYFTNGNPASGVPATILDADWLNMVQQELLNIVEAGGLTPSKTTYNQVLEAIQIIGQRGASSYATDTSATANTITLALTPPITAYTDGQQITFKAANSNTDACTVNAGGGSVNLVGAAGSLQGGEIVAEGQYTALYSASLGEFVLVGQTAGPLQVVPATKSNQAVNLGQFAASISGSGYQTHSSGLIIQWGNYSTSGTQSGTTVTFPLAFPNNCFSVSLAPATNNNTLPFGTADSLGVPPSKTGFTVIGVQISSGSATLSSHNGYYIAIGH